mmetsp:Transcript_22727/g.77320  ORF Transcript_22727/g.77320 Transcript_22727/m.77320 type:complete len:304 (-) Transcript_22727:128-1039(-)
MAPGPSTARASATRISSWPRCTPAAPDASATSTRSFISTGTPVPAAARTASLAAATSAPPSRPFSRTCTTAAPPATAATTASCSVRPRLPFAPASVTAYTHLLPLGGRPGGAGGVPTGGGGGHGLFCQAWCSGPCGPVPTVRGAAALRAPSRYAFAARHAPSAERPRARCAATELASVHPVPWVFAVGTRGPRRRYVVAPAPPAPPWSTSTASPPSSRWPPLSSTHLGPNAPRISLAAATMAPRSGMRLASSASASGTFGVTTSAMGKSRAATAAASPAATSLSPLLVTITGSTTTARRCACP